MKKAEIKLFRPQNVMFMTLFVGYTLYVLCRKSFTFLIPVFSQQESITKAELGLIVSAQNTASAGSKFFLGILSDKASPRIMFSAGLLSASVALVGFASVASVPLYASLWFLNGVAQGCGWPACAKLLQNWYRPEEFGTYWSVLSASVNVSGIVTPLVLPFLLSFLGGWRAFMIFAGCMGLSCSVASFFLLKNCPEDVGLPPVRDSFNKNDNQKMKSSSASYKTLFSSPFLWLLFLQYMVIYGSKTACENWGQLLVREKGLSQSSASLFLSSFEVGGFLSSLGTGYLVDWVVAREGMNLRKNPRMKVLIAYTAFSVLLTHLIATTTIFLPLLAFLLGAAMYGNANIFGILGVECAPSHLTGTATAFIGLGSNMGAVLSGLPLSLVAQSYGWTGAFYLLEFVIGLCLVSMILSRGLSTQIEEKTHQD